MDVVQKEIGMEKPAQNIQDSFLNNARKDKSNITIYLLSGVKLTGRIRSFDKYSVVLETNNQEQLIFKHAISTVVMARGAHLPHERPPAPAEVKTPGATSAASETTPATSGTQG
ncbi:MAG: RNA chaperone Hfq [Terriglobales bacterium]